MEISKLFKRYEDMEAVTMATLEKKFVSSEAIKEVTLILDELLEWGQAVDLTPNEGYSLEDSLRSHYNNLDDKPANNFENYIKHLFNKKESQKAEDFIHIQSLNKYIVFK